MRHTDIPRLNAEQIAHYATILNFKHSDVNYFYNLQAPGQNYDDHCAISREIVRRERVAAIEAFDTTPEIKAHMLTITRGGRKPERVDYTAFLKGALENKCSPFGKTLPAYKPEPGACGIKLRPAEAVRISYSQESYSDDSAVAIPYTVTAGKPADKAVFARNVSELVSRANSHNGWAGSGATYGAGVRDGFVVVSCRSSIAD